MAKSRKTVTDADVDHLFYATDDKEYRAKNPKRWNALQRKRARNMAKKKKTSGSSGG